jgi:DNA transposition AAA+ family ATPase
LKDYAKNADEIRREKKTPYEIPAAQTAAMAQDEADYLSGGSLELVRRVINDKAQTGVVLAGLLRLEYKLENLRNDRQQLTSRVGALPEVKRLAKPDAIKVIEGVWKGLAHEVVDAFIKTARRLGADAGQVDGARSSGGGDEPHSGPGRGIRGEAR